MSPTVRTIHRWLWVAVLAFAVVGAETASAAEIHRLVRMWPEMRQPWYFLLPFDVDADADGYIYVADTENHRIRKFNRDGGFVTEWRTFGPFAGQLYKPHGIAVDSRRGWVYVADTENDRVQRFDRNGTFDPEWGETPAGELSVPYAVAVDETGCVYVADTGNSRIVRYDENRRMIGEWNGDASGDGPLDWPKGILAEGGRIYVADTENHRIGVFTPDGEWIDWWDEGQGDGEGQLDLPTDIAADGAGGFYVADNFNDRIQRFSAEGDFLSTWGVEGTGEGEFVSPSGVAVSDGRVYVADLNNRRIQVFLPDGWFVDKWASTGNGPGEMERPQGVAVAPDGTVYVADTNNHRIQVFDGDGNYLRAWGEEGSGEGELNIPHALTVADGKVYVADTLNDRVLAFDPSGGLVAQWPADGPDPELLDDPAGVASDGAGFLYVTDWENHRVIKLDADLTGPVGDPWGGFGSAPGFFKSPRGIAVDGDRVFVADADNKRVQVFDREGKHLEVWDAGGSLRRPIGLAADSTGAVYLTDASAHRVVRLGPDGTALSSFGREGTDPGQMRDPSGVAVAPDGRVLVADTENSRIQVFERVAETRPNKAIIVAGGGPYPGNLLWPATQATAHFAYRTLTHQGFDKETIYYLSPETGLDLDQNGRADDVDAAPGHAALESALTGWAADADNLVLFLTDHGRAGSFRLSESETVTAEALDGWLDELAGQITGRIVVIYDACNAGSFLPTLAAPDRIVITSTDIDEDAWFVGQGAVSFSAFFWSGVFAGKDLAAAFEMAESALAGAAEGQHPLLDGDGNGIGNEAADRETAAGTHVVSGTPYPGKVPVFERMDARIDPADPGRAMISARPADPGDVVRVWAVVRPTSVGGDGVDETLLSLPSVELLPAGGGEFAGTWPGIVAGTDYRVTGYARNRLGNTGVSAPEILSPVAPPQRRAVIIRGPVPDDAADAVEAAADLARDALQFQGYTDIRFLAGDGTASDADGPADPAALRDVLADWGPDTRQGVVVLLGAGVDGKLLLAGGQILDPAALDDWLDRLPGDLPDPVTVIGDLSSSGAGALLPALTPPSGRERIVMASAPAGSLARFAADGAVSFSAFFWRAIREGRSVGEAFSAARSGLGLTSGDDLGGPLLDDTGDGIGNERADGVLAARTWLGAGIRLTADAPYLAPPADDGPACLPGEPVILRVDGSRNPDGEVSVWATVTAPEVEAEVRTVPMEAVGQGAYEGRWTCGTTFGSYPVGFFAEDDQGNRALGRETTVYVTAGPDRYEPDDTPDRADPVLIDAPTPRHQSLHAAGDRDWTTFYAVPGVPYTVTFNPADLAYGLTVSLHDASGAVLDERETLPGGDPVVWPLTRLAGGVHRLMVRPTDPAAWAEGGGYTLGVNREVAVFAGFVAGRLVDAGGDPVAGATIRMGGASAVTRPDGRYLMIGAPGTLSVEVGAEGFDPFSADVTVGEGGTTVADFTLSRTVVDRFPWARILAPAGEVTVTAGESVRFEGDSDDGDPPLYHQWDFGGGAPPLTGQRPGLVTFEAPGTYRVTYTVTDADGDSDSDTRTVTVAPADRQPTVTMVRPAGPVTVSVGEAVVFSAAVTGGDPPFVWLWEFGGGAGAANRAEPDPVAFSASGEYRVTVTVTDDDGDEATASVTVTVTPNGAGPDRRPSATIRSPAGDLTVTAGESVSFAGAADGGDPPLSFQWDFGTGMDPVSGIDPGEVIFGTPGVYPVIFTAVDGDGDRAAASVTVTVIAPPPLRPHRPDMVDPVDGAVVSITPTLALGPYSHPDGVVHGATVWQIAMDLNFETLVFDLESHRWLTTLPVPPLLLEPDADYSVRCRVIDENGGASDWSPAAGFTTAPDDGGDSDADGVRDDQAVDESVDTDRDGVPDLHQAGLTCVTGGPVGTAVCSKVEPDGAEVVAMKNLDPWDVGDGVPADGLIGVRLSVDEPGGSVELLLMLAEAMPTGTGWRIYHLSGDEMTDISDGLMTERRTVRLTVTDGGEADADGLENGAVVLFTGPVGPELRSLSVSGPGADSVGGAGCFVESSGR